MKYESKAILADEFANVLIRWALLSAGWQIKYNPDGTHINNGVVYLSRPWKTSND